MLKYELSISPSYVPDWTVIDAIREIFQNALDQEKENSENKMNWEWSHEDQTLLISSKGSRLTKETILFGSTTKADKDSQIGCFGEGYKLALLVLTRLGFSVEIHNYQEKEKWFPVIEKSKKYQSDILVIYVKKHIFTKVPDNDLTFIIPEVDPELFNRIGHSNLHLYKPKSFEEVHEGRILLDGRCKGKIYVNGLYICDKNDFQCGYDIKPKYLKIGRDRKLVDDFDLQWILGQMWVQTKNKEFLVRLIEKGTPDIKYVETQSGYNSSVQIILRDKFINKYGDRAIPVSSQTDYNRVKNNYRGVKPVFVPAQVYGFLKSQFDHVYEKAEPIEGFKLPYEILHDFRSKYKYSMSDGMLSEFNMIIKQSSRWDWKENL